MLEYAYAALIDAADAAGALSMKERHCIRQHTSAYADDARMQMLDVSVKLKDAVEAYEERHSKILSQKERIRGQATLLEEQVCNRACIEPS